MALKTGLVVLLLVTSGGMVRTEAAAHQAQTSAQTSAQVSAQVNAQVNAKPSLAGPRSGARPAATESPTVRCAGPSRCTRARSWPGSPTATRSAAVSGCHVHAATSCPQGLAFAAGNTAWISGFRHRDRYGHAAMQAPARRPDHRAERLELHRSIYGRVGKRPRTYCRHGGGILARGGALWVVEKNKLWLVDPKKSGSVLNARRVWRLRSPIRGSAVVANGNRIGLVPYQTRGPAHIHWFAHQAPDALGRARPRRTPQGQEAASASRPGPGIPSYRAGRDDVRRTPLPRAFQPGLRRDRHPDRQAHRLGPGAEGIQFRAGDRLWAVSESGAPPYARSRKPLTPAIASFGWERLVGGKASKCRFRAR